MKRRKCNRLLAGGTVLPLVMLFWPFAQWGTGMNLVLRVIPSASLQMIFCKTVRCHVVKLLPVVCAGLFAAWGMYLYFTSPHWSHATVGGLLVDYISPFISCAAAYGIWHLRRKKEVNLP